MTNFFSEYFSFYELKLPQLTFPASFFSGDFSMIAAGAGAAAVSAILINSSNERRKSLNKI